MMKFNYFFKKNMLTGIFLLSLIAINGFFVQCSAEKAQSVIKNNDKELIIVIPLNITADEQTEKTIKNSIEKFFLQRLNNKQFIAKTSLSLSDSSSEELNNIYTSIALNIIDERIKSLDGKDYICGGNVFALGDSVVADFFLFDLQTGKKIVESNASGNNIGKILTLADFFTNKINAFFSSPVTDKLANKTAGDFSLKINSTELNADKNFLIKSDKIKGKITSTVFCKLDETGKSYIVYSLFDKIVTMEIKDNSFIEKNAYINDKSERIIGLISIDTDQDGIEELLVSNIKSDKRTINSYVLKMENGKFEKSLSGLNWIFSSDSSGFKKTKQIVYAQKHGTMKTTLDSGIFTLSFEKGRINMADNPLAIPSWVRLPALSLNPESDLAFGVAYRPDSSLSVFDKKNELFWESRDAFGGSNTYFSEENSVERENANRIWLNAPVKFAEIYRGNKYKEIITVKNYDSTKNLLAGIRNYKEGKITILSMNDLSCKVVAESSTVTGYISSFDLGLSEKDEDALLLYSVVQTGKNLFSKKRSYLVVQNVKSLKGIN